MEEVGDGGGRTVVQDLLAHGEQNFARALDLNDLDVVDVRLFDEKRFGGDAVYLQIWNI